MTNLTSSERERIAFIQGQQTAGLLAELADIEALKTASETAIDYMREAVGQYPDEDCLQDVIDTAQTLSKGRVTMAQMAALAEQLEELQVKLSRASEYGREQLDKAETELFI